MIELKGLSVVCISWHQSSNTSHCNSQRTRLGSPPPTHGTRYLFCETSSARGNFRRTHRSNLSISTSVGLEPRPYCAPANRRKPHPRPSSRDDISHSVTRPILLLLIFSTLSLSEPLLAHPLRGVCVSHQSPTIGARIMLPHHPLCAGGAESALPYRAERAWAFMAHSSCLGCVSRAS